MSLSTLLEAAKYLDYLDSSSQQQQQQHQPMQLQFQPTQSQQQPQPQTSKQRSTRRHGISKKNAANTMVAMSLPSTRGAIQMHSVPIPVGSNGSSGGSENHQATSLSSSFTTGSPLSSFASTALFYSKASGVTSASSSAASSLSSSDSSSSCGEISMGDTDFNQSMIVNTTGKDIKTNHLYSKNNNNNNNSNDAYINNHQNYHLTHQQFETNHQLGDQPSSGHQFSSSNSSGNSINSSNNHRVARYIAATSSGPQLVTMTTSSASSSAPVDVGLRAGHVIHAATNHGAIMNASPSTSFDSNRHFSVSSANGGIHHHQQIGFHDGQTYSVSPGSFGSDNHLPGSYQPLMMTRVPMALNSMSPSAQSIMVFQPATASSPTSSSSSYSRHRELHKTLEKNRRAHLRHCFELLKAELPASECVDKKKSHINIIKSAIRYVLALRQQECEIENELQRLTRIKTELTENLSILRNTNNGNTETDETNNNNSAPQSSSHGQSTQSPQQTSAQQVSDLQFNHQEQRQQKQQQQQQQQQDQLSNQPPAAEQQLSFLLSQSKID